MNAWEKPPSSGTRSVSSKLKAPESTTRSMDVSDASFPDLPALKIQDQQTQRASSADKQPEESEANRMSYREAAKSMPAPHVRQVIEPKDPDGIKDFPFLSHSLTRQYLKQPGSKLMLVLRGVSGSGKSTLVDQIKTLRNCGIQVDVTSADYLFEKTGTYKFERDRLGEAHESSKRECEKYCADPYSHIVVVDNTNIKYWEFQPYLRMAHRFQFVTLLVEPRTSWRYDVAELAKRNIHGVENDVLAEKVKLLRDSFVYPSYYGWTLSARDSGLLRQLAAKYATAMLLIDDLHTVVDFNHDLLVNYFIRRSEDDLVQLAEGEDLFHCTAFYTAFGKRPGVPEYEKSDVVIDNLGKCHLLKIDGLLVTKQTISFRVDLNPEQLKLWNEEEQSHPTVPRGSRAHLTVATARGVPAKAAGDDILDLREREMHSQPDRVTCITTGRVFRYGPDVWYLALEKSNIIPSLFAPFYTRDRREQ